MRRSRAGFSLVEVVVALAVLTGGIVVILALLPNLLRRQADARQVQVALQLPAGITTHLQQVGAGGLSVIAGRLADLGADTSGSLRLVAARDGTDVRELGNAETVGRDQYFLVELYRFPASSALAYDPNGTVLPVHVRVSWPYRADDGGSPRETAAADRQGVSFNVVVNR